MKNITLAIDEKLLEKGREYARKHQLSLNGLIRKLLEETLYEKHEKRLESCFELMDKENVSSEGKKWTRDDLYEP
ncbi:MAG: DUF6364 family protein [Calditrichota bacterium]